MYAKIEMPTEIDGAAQIFAVDTPEATIRMVYAIARKRTREYDYAIAGIETVDGTTVITFKKAFKKTVTTV